MASKRETDLRVQRDEASAAADRFHAMLTSLARQVAKELVTAPGESEAFRMACEVLGTVKPAPAILEPDGTAFARSWGARLLAQSCADPLFRPDGPPWNFVEFRFIDPRMGELLVTVQRVSGKTPATLKAAAETERDEARAEVARLRERVATLEGVLCAGMEDR